MEAPKKLLIETEKMCLDLLPNEIMFHIFELLPPLSLLAMGRINQRYLLLTCDPMVLKNVDFSKYSRIFLKDLSDFFISARAAFILELNLNDCHWIGSPLLEKCIEICERMHTLSVNYCSLTLTAILRILTKLKHLSNFSWTVSIEDTGNRVDVSTPELKQALGNLKKICFAFVYKDSISHFLVLWNEFLPSCSNLQELAIEFNQGGYPEYDGTLEITEMTRIHDSLESLTLSSSWGVSGHSSASRIYESITKLLYNAKAPGIKWRKLWIDIGFSWSRNSCIVDKTCITDFNLIECLQINYGEKTSEMFANAEILENVCASSIHTLSVGDFESLKISKIIAACGKKLKRFIPSSFKYDNISPTLVGDLQDLFSACSNITDLDIGGIHFHDSAVSVCSAICYLKHLQQLRLPLCAVKGASKGHADEISHIHSSEKKLRISNPFSDMVENCKFIKEFRLQGCLHQVIDRMNVDVDYVEEYENDCIDEDDIQNIYLWEMLQCLTLSQLRIKSFNFLKMIALQCKLVSSLSISHIGKPPEYNYLPNLCFLIENAHCLSFLEIDELDADLVSTDIWQSISRAKNLERIIFSGGYPTAINTLAIRNSVSELSKLRTFHLRFSEIASKVFHELQEVQKYLESRNVDPGSKIDIDFYVNTNVTDE